MDELRRGIESVNAARKGIKSFSARFVMNVSRQKSLPFSKSFRGEMVCEMPDKLRIKGYAGGMVPAFDIAIKPRKVKLFIPRRNQMIEGTRSRFRKVPVVKRYSIDALLDAELGRLFVPKLPTKQLFWEAGKDGLWLYHWGLSAGQWERMLLDQKTFLPARKQVFSEDGRLLVEITFSDYRQVSAVKVPFALDLVNPTERLRITMRVASLSLNVPVVGGAFNIIVPEGVNRVGPDDLEQKMQKNPDTH